MASHFDTIVAPITTVPGPVAMIRLSGPDAWEVASKVFAPWRPEAMRIAYGHLSTGDDGFAIPFEVGRSYTGEPSVEISMHGSVASVGAATEACLSAGARLAEPGEFTLRAFLNGRIDLTQAEAVRDAIEARTSAQLRAASRQREGAIRDRVRAIAAILQRQLATLEASVDFSEEIGEFDTIAAGVEIETARALAIEALRSADAGRWLRDGFQVAIVGAPNAGKSSLFNALVGHDRAIVTPIAGTTRDAVDAEVEIRGVMVRFVDTAGVRATDDIVEALGVDRTWSALRHADAAILVIDSLDPVEIDVPPDQITWRVANKVDLEPRPSFPHDLGTSARTGQGISELIDAIAARIGVEEGETPIAPRHAQGLRAAVGILDELGTGLRYDRPPDLLSGLLNDAIQELGKITGDHVDADVITRVFRDFCIGK